MNKHERFLCLSHPDFHMPEDVVIGDSFDADAYVARLKAAGVDAVVQFATCHYGHAYYPTRIGTPHPNLRCDMLGEMSRACRAQGMGIVGYHSVFLASTIHRDHPDWRFQATDTRADAGFDSDRYGRICVNSPFLEEYFLPICRETAAHCDLDELFLDTMCGFRPCYCPHCVETFGGPIPSDASKPDWERYVAFYRHCHEAFFLRVVDTLNEEFPDLAVIFNWTWSHRQGTTAPDHIKRLAADLIPTPRVASDVCRYFGSSGKPYVYMCGRFHNGLGDWSNLVDDQIRLVAASTVANGGSFYLIDRQLPHGQLEERAYEAMGAVFPWLQERRPWLIDATPLQRVCILWDDSTINGPTNEFFPEMDIRKQRLARYEGCSRLLRDHGRDGVACGATRLLAILPEIEVLLIPEAYGLADEVITAIGDWVAAGGKLLLSLPQQEEEVDDRLLALAGIERIGRSPFDYHYLRTSCWDSMRTPLWHLRGGETLIGTGAVMQAGGTAGTFGHGLAPVTGPDRWPWAVQATRGAGQIICIAAPVFEHLGHWPHPRVEAAMIALLDNLDPDCPVRLSTPAQVELGCTRLGDDLIIHLVNHSGREDLGGYWHPTIAYLPRIRDIAVQLKTDGRALTISHIPDGAPVILSNDGSFIADELHDLHSYVVHDYFAS